MPRSAVGGVALASALLWPDAAALAITAETRAERRAADAAALLAPAVRSGPGNADLDDVPGFALRKSGCEAGGKPAGAIRAFEGR